MPIYRGPGGAGDAQDAGNQAQVAQAAAVAAQGSASAAAVSAASAASSYDSFDDRYLGAKASDPTLDNDNNALITGALYFNTATNQMKAYTGSAWVNAAPSGALVASNNLSDLTNTTTARTNLGVAIGVNVQAYDADTAKYDDTTANFTGTLQNGGSNVLVDTDIGTTVQSYDADTAKYDDTTANFTGTLQNGGSNVVVDSDIGSTVQGYDADTAKLDVAQSWTAAQTFGSGYLKLSGSSSGTATLNAPAAASTNTYTLPPDASTLGYRNAPAVGTKTGSYQLSTADVGKYVQVGSGGSITIPDATFAEGDVVSIFNNTSAGITITCSITTAYIAGTDSDKASVTLAARGVATVLFISSTVCVITGNVI